MPLLPAAVRGRLRDKALAAARRLSTGPEWERHVRDEFDLLAPSEAWRERWPTASTAAGTTPARAAAPGRTPASWA